MGYGRRAVQLLQAYYEGKRHSLSEQNSHLTKTLSSTASQVDSASVFACFLLNNLSLCLIVVMDNVAPLGTYVKVIWYFKLW